MTFASDFQMLNLLFISYLCWILWEFQTTYLLEQWKWMESNKELNKTYWLQWKSKKTNEQLADQNPTQNAIEILTKVLQIELKYFAPISYENLTQKHFMIQLFNTDWLIISVYNWYITHFGKVLVNICSSYLISNSHLPIITSSNCSISFLEA